MPQDQVVEPQKTSKLGSIMLWILVIVLLGASYGIYYWQHQKVTDLQAKVAAPAASPAPAAATVADVTVGYPLSIPKTKILTTLILPSGYGILQSFPPAKTAADLQSHYTTSFNDIIASWEAKLLGTKANPSASGHSDGETLVEITALTQWMNVNDPEGTDYSATQSSMTVAQKKVFVAGLVAKTTACVKDASKGFVTDDKVYNVCYELTNPQSQNGDYGVTLNGYATIKGQPVYLRGSVLLPNSFSNHQVVLDKYIATLRQLATSVSAQ